MSKKVKLSIHKGQDYIALINETNGSEFELPLGALPLLKVMVKRFNSYDALTAKVDKLEKMLNLSKEKLKKLKDNPSINVGVYNFCIKALDEIESLTAEK